MLPVMTPVEHAGILQPLHGEEIVCAPGHQQSIMIVLSEAAVLTVAGFDDHAPTSVEPNIVVGNLHRLAVM